MDLYRLFAEKIEATWIRASGLKQFAALAIRWRRSNAEEAALAVYFFGYDRDICRYGDFAACHKYIEFFYYDKTAGRDAAKIGDAWGCGAGVF